ncbi:MAG: hypothetical protein ACREB3_02740, partial [Burkholderiales bacterium]
AFAESVGARVTNNSNSAGGIASSAIETKYAQTRSSGMVHFASAGNAAVSVSSYPASLPSVNSVAALNRFGGRASFSSFGPDTLKELRAAFQGLDRNTHVHRFIDMHDIGDRLVACGFADPVMDMEVVTLTYADVRGLMRDLKAIGAHNVTRGRPAGLGGKSRLAGVSRNYEAFRRDGKLPATFEVVYGHAWKPAARVSPTGHPVIDIKPDKKV